MTDEQHERGQLAVWEDYLQGHTAIMRALERELQAAHALSLAEYDVLLHLHNAPHARLRMGELAEAVLFSTGGVSRLLDRLERAGAVARERTASDRRGVYAVLTESGRATLRAASRTHLRGVECHFTTLLHAEEGPAVGAFLARLVAQATAAPHDADATAPIPTEGRA
jgi:DNA-binding MarR family transcriptional regulator